MAAAVVTKDTLIGDLLRIDANVAPILLGIGMHCLGCPSSQGETIEEAALKMPVKREVICPCFCMERSENTVRTHQ